MLTNIAAAPPPRSPPAPAAELLTCPEIICRAWDSCMNTQPNTFTWCAHRLQRGEGALVAVLSVLVPAIPPALLCLCQPAEPTILPCMLPNAGT